MDSHKTNTSKQAEFNVDSENQAGELGIHCIKYDDLVDFVGEIQNGSVSRHVVDDDVKSFIHLEARLLDNRDYDHWLSLFSAECLYWVPNRYELGDPRSQAGIYLDDQRRMIDRVSLIRTGFLHAQTPPSRTLRTISNIEQWKAPNGNTRTCMNIVIWEYRKGHLHCFPARQAYEIKGNTKESGQGSIQLKMVQLLDCDSPQGNYTFIY